MPITRIMEGGSYVRITSGLHKGSWGCYQFTDPEGRHDVVIQEPTHDRVRVADIIQIKAKDLTREELPGFLKEDLGNTESDADYLWYYLAIFPLAKEVGELDEQIRDAMEYLDELERDLGVITYESVPEVTRMISQVKARRKILKKLREATELLLCESKRVELESGDEI